VLGKLNGMGQGRNGPTTGSSRGRGSAPATPKAASGPEVKRGWAGLFGAESATKTSSSRDDIRAGLMSRQVGSLNVWKAPVTAGPATTLRYAKRCSRSPSPIPRHKVSFRLCAAVAATAAAADPHGPYPLLSLAENPGLRSGSSFRSRRPRRTDGADSMTDSSSSSASSGKSSLKVSRQSDSLLRTYDPVRILQEGEKEKRVAFSTVSVHLHPMTLGDNPSVSEGIPVQISWKATESFTRPLDEHEKEEGRRRPGPPRTVEELRIAPTRREHLLREAGENRDDMLRVLRAVALVQASRDKNAGLVSVDAASAASSSSSNNASRRIRSGTPLLPSVLQRFVVSRPSSQMA
jgi:hypothetical protein